MLSFPFLSLCRLHLTDLILLPRGSINLLTRFSRQRLAGETHDFRYPAWAIWMEPSLHKMLIVLPPGRLGDSGSVLARFCRILQHLLIKCCGGLPPRYWCHFALQEPNSKGADSARDLLNKYTERSQGGIPLFERPWAKVSKKKNGAFKCQALTLLAPGETCVFKSPLKVNLRLPSLAGARKRCPRF